MIMQRSFNKFLLCNAIEDRILELTSCSVTNELASLPVSWSGKLALLNDSSIITIIIIIITTKLARG